MRVYRQGDVLIVATKEIPADARPVERDNGRVILAYGEVTGHAHAILDTEAELFERLEAEMGERFLALAADVDLVHEEHSTIRLPKGTYRVVGQVEYTPTEIRRVAD